MTEIENCERCGCKIVEQPHRRPYFTFSRFCDEKNIEDRQIDLCSVCLDEIWKFVFYTKKDRSDKADPIPLERAKNNLKRHIEELEDMIEELEAAKTEDAESKLRGFERTTLTK
jgi:hypothetical protein